MSEEKISSDEVPGKFTEWLLSMGCPADKVPSQDKIANMCRGQYYMVWRSLMERVDARDAVREKRMQVFCDDVRRCQKKNEFSENSSTIVPEELLLWKQQSELMKKVEEAKARVALARHDLEQLTDKISNKMSQRCLLRGQVESTFRRAYFLECVAGELRDKKTDLEETRDIAHSLCHHSDDDDVQAKLDKCLSAFQRQTSINLSTSNASISTNSNDFEEQVSQLVKMKGDLLCMKLYERRAALVKALAVVGAESPRATKNKVTPQSVLAHTAALHCTLSLEATKNKIHLKHTRKKLLETVTELNDYLSHDSCELLVLRCEKAHLSARVAALRTLLEEITTNSGVFQTPGSGTMGPMQGNPTHAVDKAIVSKREELKRVMSSLSETDRKMQTARECLQLILQVFRPSANHVQPSHCRGVQLELPSESIPSLRQFYCSVRERNRRRVDLSMELEVSDRSLDLTDCNNPRFVDELRIYLKKFNLENNRQLVLESGEKMWIFETIQASVSRLYSSWATGDVSCSALCPAVGIAASARRMADIDRDRLRLEATVRALQVNREIRRIEITSQKEEEQQITDRTKKRLRENLLDLQKTTKIFALAEGDLKFWSDNNIRKYISPSRKHDGMTYRDYEVYYMANCINVV